MMLVLAVASCSSSLPTSNPPPSNPPPVTPPPIEPPPEPPDPIDPPPVGTDLVYTQGFEDGPVGPENTPGLRTTSHPDVVVEWQRTVVRTGQGAYHMRGGDLSNGDADIFNHGRVNPLGGLEVWAGGAFYFTSFPVFTGSRPVWLLATVPTDGILGADDKPVAAISSNGRLILISSDTEHTAELDVPLQRNHWYFLVLHGVNGIGRTQELYLYDGTTGALLGRASVAFDVTGTFRDQLTKWGFGTSQDSTGLEYYLDDIYHARGGVNPGPLRMN